MSSGPVSSSGCHVLSDVISHRRIADRVSVSRFGESLKGSAARKAAGTVHDSLYQVSATNPLGFVFA